MPGCGAGQPAAAIPATWHAGRVRNWALALPGADLPGHCPGSAGAAATRALGHVVKGPVRDATSGPLARRRVRRCTRRRAGSSRFSVTRDQRNDPSAYVSTRRGTVTVGAARMAVPDARARTLASWRVGRNLTSMGRCMPARCGTSASGTRSIGARSESVPRQRRGARRGQILIDELTIRGDAAAARVGLDLWYAAGAQIRHREVVRERQLANWAWKIT